ncbi:MULTISPECIES: GNAT family N-acetyltransferase [Microbacterium]|uniref:GNAT family N-acetyltransferase n=1 Tax=Microbacterium TaxID=33882 RepID=UPI0011EB5CBB|nr:MULTISPECIES: GNAT family N-acetyltransferase [Microbacterium]
MSVVIRSATDQDHAALEEIERAADRLLTDRFSAEDWPPPSTEDDRRNAGGFVLVATVSPTAEAPSGVEEVPVGFAQVLEGPGYAHLEQLSVHPAYGRRGIGRALVVAAQGESRRRGHTHLTLRTYADVPWNAPFYAGCGFVESTPDTAFLRELVTVEQRLGLTRHGRRIQMTAVL